MPIPIDVDQPADSPLSGGDNGASGGSISPNPIINTGRATGRLLYDKFKFNETKFTSLKYTGDSFNGANTSEPLIQKSISIPRIGRIANPRVIAKENEKRISLLLNTTGRGFKFIQNQKNLTFSNSRLESIGNQSPKLRFTSLAFYNPQTTLNQIGRDPLEQGEHYTRFGISPFMDDSLKYTGVVTKNNGTNTNRLSKLRTDLGIEFELNEDRKVFRNISNIRGTSLTDFTSGIRGAIQGIGDFANAVTGIVDVFGGNSRITNVANKVNNIARAAVSYLSPTIDQYQGGPGSINGIGTTTIRRFDYTNNYAKTKLIKQLAQNKIYTADYAKKPLPSNPGSKISKEQEKKVQQLEKTPSTKLEEIASNLTGYTYRVTNQLPNNKVKNGNRVNWTRNNGEGPGSTIASLFSSANNIRNGKLKNIYDDNGIEDISDKSDRMPIVFRIIDPFTGISEKDWKFSAYLNGFKDTSSPKHTEISYIGRSEYFYVYDKFTRSVSFNFQIPCYNLADLRSKHRYLAALYSSTMGKYNKGGKLGGILYQLKVGNYLDYETGIITNMSYDIPNDSSWDIDEQLAHNLNVSISYNVIHSSLPQYDNSGYNLFTIGGSFFNNSLNDSNPINKYKDVKNIGKLTPDLLPVTKPSLPTLTAPPIIQPQNPVRSSNSGGMLGMSNS